MLKLLACLFMLLDHIGYFFAFALPEPLVLVLRTLGRLAFPIFAWSVARGYSRTRNIFRYFLRMSIFAALTEVLFRLMYARAGLTMPSSNVLVTFALAIALLTGFRLATRSGLDMIASLRPVSPTPQTLPTASRFDVRINIGGIELDRRIGLPLGLALMLLAMAATFWLQPDYGLYGLLTVLLFYAVYEWVPEKQRPNWSILGFLILNLVFLFFRIFVESVSPYWAILQCFSVAALPFCHALDRERRPGQILKYAFYLFYPLHILLLLFLRILIWPK